MTFVHISGCDVSQDISGARIILLDYDVPKENPQMTVYAEEIAKHLIYGAYSLRTILVVFILGILYNLYGNRYFVMWNTLTGVTCVVFLKVFHAYTFTNIRIRNNDIHLWRGDGFDLLYSWYYLFMIGHALTFLYSTLSSIIKNK